MNKTYKVVWNESLGTWCAISETSKVRGKRSTGKAVVAGAILAVSALTVSGMSFAANPDHYISVNDGGTQSGNYDNDGAKGQNSVAVGVDAVTGTVGNDIAIGSGAQAMGGRAVVIGLNAGSGNVSDGDANVLIGMNAGANNDGRWNTAIGSNSGFNIKGERNTALGDYAGRDVTGSGNIGLGASAGVSVTGETNLAVGISAGGTVKGDHNVALGRTAGDDVIGTGNVATGLDSGSIVRGSVNVSYGQGSGRSVTGDRNTAMGLNAGNGVSGNDNVAMAWGAGYEVAGRGNLALGALTGRTVNGNDNIAIGSQSGTKVNGSRNIALGVQSGQDLDNVNDATSLGSSAKANADNAIAIGKGANASATSSIALGSGSTATLKGGVAIGDGAYSGGKNSGGSIVIGGAIDQSDYAPALNGARNDESAQASIVIGSGASNKGAIATVIGTGASAGVEGGSTVIGSFASSTTSGTALGGSAKVIGRNGTAVGLEAVAYNDGVALGTLSVANRNAGTLGYDPSSKSIAVTGSHIASLSGIMSAVSVGDTDKKIYRQITNVAAGTVDTDAVNVAQLKAAQAAATTHYVSVNDGGTQSGNYNNDGAKGLNSLAIGVNSSATGSNSLAIGLNSSASGTNSIAMGVGNQMEAEGNISFGNGNIAKGGNGSQAVGEGNNINGWASAAFGRYNEVNGSESLAAGSVNKVTGDFNTVVGRGNNVGSGAGSSAFGDGNNVQGWSSGAFGRTNEVSGNEAFALGSSNKLTSSYSIIVGRGNNIGGGEGSSVVGNNNNVQGWSSGTLGQSNTVRGNESYAGGNANNVQADYSMVLGRYNKINNGFSYVVGDSNIVNGSGVGILGNNNTVAQNDTYVLGSGITTTQANSVLLGNASTDRAATTVDKVTINGEDYVVAGAGSVGNGIVSVGKAGAERQIINVAAGEVSATSTDAVNGSQLFATNKAIADSQTHYVSVNDDGIQGGNYNNDGAQGKNSLALGVGAKATGENAIAIGNVTTDAANSIAIGNNNVLSNTAGASTVIGSNNNVTGNEAVALGSNNTVKDFSGVAVGSYNRAFGYRSITVGAENQTDGQWSSAIGLWNTAGGERATALGANNKILGRRALGVGVVNEISSASEYSSAIGAFNKITDSTKSLAAGFSNTITGGDNNNVLGNENQLNNAKNSTVIGNKNIVAQDNTQVLGNNVTTTQANSVILGNASTDRAATTVDKVTINGEDYTVAGAGSVANGIVSVGKAGAERQIINVAAGKVSSDSTDAVNGSQLYATNKAIADSKTHYISINDGGTQTGNYNNDGAIGKNSIAIGVASKAENENSVALGNNAVSNYGGIAIGSGVKASNGGSTVIGSNSVALANNAHVIGTNNRSEQQNSSILGNENQILTSSGTSLAIGNNNILTSGGAATLGFGNQVSGASTLALGTGNNVTNMNTTAVGIGNQISGNGSIALGTDNTVQSDSSGILGRYNQVNKGSVAYVLGQANNVSGSSSAIVGISNIVANNNTFVLGNQVTTTQDNSVILGNKSTDRAATSESKVSINGQDYAFAGVGSAANGVVSVGKAGAERQIINVAAGKVSSDSTDAVNGSQLYATNQAITEVGKSAAAAKTEVVEGDNIVVTETQGKNGQSIYNVATAKEVSFDKTTVGTVITDRTTGKITGLTAGEVSATSTDAINGSQLYATNQAIADSKTHYVSVNDDGVQADNYNNDGATGKNALAVGVGSKAAGENVVAIGYNNNVAQDKTVVLGSSITTTQANSVILGNESTDRAATSESKVTILGQDYVFAGVGSVSNGVVSVGKAGAERQIINVAAGKVSSDSTDAVNGSQLYATNQAITEVGKSAVAAKTEVMQGDNIVVTETQGKNGQSVYNVATAKEVSFNKTTVGTVITDSATGKITGLTAGEVSATSTDAINGSQLYATNKAIADSKTHYVSVNDGGVQADNYNNDGATGKNALAVGVGSKAAGENAVVIGYNNNVAQDKTVALGSSITTTQANSVVLGNESIDRAATAESKVTILGQDYAFAGVGSAANGVVSVGKVGGERQIINVAAGQLSATSTDAVNGSQLYATNQAISSLQGQVSGAKSTVTEGKNTTVTKTTHADGSTDYQVATKDDVSFDSVTVGNIKADAQSNKISGLSDGEVSATSNEAVNGSQLHGTAESVANVLGGNAKINADGTVSTSNIGNTGKDNVHDAIASLQGQVAGSKTSVSAGKNTVVNSSTNADGSNNYQVALADNINLNSVTANQVTANQVKADQVIANQVMANQVNVGKVTIDGTSNKVSGLANGTISKDSTDAINGSQLHQTNSNVAQYLGGGSTLNQDGSIKAPTYNVAGGSYNNVGDALGAVDTRVSNLEQAFYNTNKNVDDLRNDTYAGIAGAMAVGNLPQPTEAGMSMMSAGLSGYRGETAVAVGISAISDSNKIIWKMGASADSRSNIGGAVSVGYQWK